jgi:hypothetical protein
MFVTFLVLCQDGPDAAFNTSFTVGLYQIVPDPTSRDVIGFGVCCDATKDPLCPAMCGNQEQGNESIAMVRWGADRTTPPIVLGAIPRLTIGFAMSLATGGDITPDGSNFVTMGRLLLPSTTGSEGGSTEGGTEGGTAGGTEGGTEDGTEGRGGSTKRGLAADKPEASLACHLTSPSTLLRSEWCTSTSTSTSTSTGADDSAAALLPGVPGVPGVPSTSDCSTSEGGMSGTAVALFTFDAKTGVPLRQQGECHLIKRN